MERITSALHLQYREIGRKPSVDRRPYRSDAQPRAPILAPDHLTRRVDPTVRPAGENGPALPAKRRSNRPFEFRLNGSLPRLNLRAREIRPVISDRQGQSCHRHLTKSDRAAGYSTSSINAIGAASPWRGPSLEIRVYPPGAAS